MALIKSKLLGDYSEEWQLVLSELKSELSTTNGYDSFFKSSELLRIEESTAVIALPSEFHIEFVEANYYDLLLNVINKVSSLSVNKLAFEAKNELLQLEPKKQIEKFEFAPKEIEDKETEIVNGHLLYKDYTFEKFVQGDSNNIPYLSAMAVAEAPGKTNYNPLIIYGKTGLGKTHLLHAIGHFSKEANTADKVYYTTALDFLSFFVKSRGNVNSFFKKFDDVDILLIDDIQFFSNKPATQKQFLLIFSFLINNGKQIVLTSDRLPEDIPDMQERLVSKFNGGLSVEIKPPHKDTKISILKRKAELSDTIISDEVLDFIASQETENVRTLEGMLTKVLASSIFAHKELDLESVKELLTDFKKEKVERITIELVQKVVAEHFSIPANQLRAQTRKKTIAVPRSIAMYLSRKLTKQAHRTIGINFGGRDYSTVISACKKIEKLISNGDIELINSIATIESKIKNQ